MRADMLTKPLDDETFARHRDTITNTGALAARPYGTLRVTTDPGGVGRM